ncbi:hypothetical protein EAF07_09515 [Streptococcus hillyeri]|uniref:Uncharacterized protein n=1 Tax=Streptococcus hillyeri TaxID=2282420 RepID=A0A3L9DMX9_9STRE|nr:hypothetical protein EAF07_09515 [Streptococcus hillyeri]
MTMQRLTDKDENFKVKSQLSCLKNSGKDSVVFYWLCWIWIWRFMAGFKCSREPYCFWYNDIQSMFVIV